MARFALILATWFLCLPLSSQEPRVPATELEGVWQEPAPPGETPGLRYRITFADDKVTIEVNGGISRGTFWLDPEAVLATIRIDIELPGDTRHALVGIYSKGQNQLTLQIGRMREPNVRVVERGMKSKPMEPIKRDTPERSPLTLTLAKVKK